MKKKQKTFKLFSIPMTWEYRGTAYVNAFNEEDARVRAQGGDFTTDESTAEIINWDIVGKAEPVDDC